MYHLPGIVPDDKATVSKLLEAEADARLSVVMKTIIETVLSKGNVRGNWHEFLLRDVFGFSLVSDTGNASEGDLIGHAGELIEARLITDKSGTYVSRSSNAGAKRDRKMTDEDLVFIRSKVWVFSYFEQGASESVTMFVSGNYVANVVEGRGRNFKFSKKAALKEFLGIEIKPIRKLQNPKKKPQKEFELDSI